MALPTKRRTEAELNDLKAGWYEDPCWDIEDTEGFEAHAEELKAFSEECKKSWEQQVAEQNAKDEEKAQKLGLVGLLRQIEALENQVRDTQEKLANLAYAAGNQQASFSA